MVDPTPTPTCLCYTNMHPACFESIRQPLEAEIARWKAMHVDAMRDMGGVVVERDAAREEARKASEATEALAKALADVQLDIDVCDWRCLNCQLDPGMAETDLAETVKAALATREAGKREK